MIAIVILLCFYPIGSLIMTNNVPAWDTANVFYRAYTASFDQESRGDYEHHPAL